MGLLCDYIPLFEMANEVSVEELGPIVRSPFRVGFDPLVNGQSK
jgi:hypothetical protein